MKKLLLNYILVLSFLTISAQNKIDYTKFQSPVKDQGSRGTCTAFGVAAILELQPGIPADISEQYLYGALKNSQKDISYFEGDYLKNYIVSLKQYGFVHEAVLPYNPKSIKWSDNDDDFSKLIRGSQIGGVSLLLLKQWAKYSINNENQYVYLGLDEANDVEKIKDLLKSDYKGVAVSYSNLNLKQWNKAGFTADSPMHFNDYITLIYNENEYLFNELKEIYEGDLIQDIRSGTVKSLLQNYQIYNPFNRKMENNYGGHVVTIVGYNEKGFKIKNSWGTDWNGDGYAFISYEAHRLMCTEALAINSVSFQKPKSIEQWNNNSTLILKNTLAKENQLELSLYTYDNLSDPDFTKVNYYIYNDEGKLLETISKTKNTGILYNNSFSISLFEKNLTPLPILLNQKAMRITVEVFFDKNKSECFDYFDVYSKTQEYLPNTCK